MSDDFDQVEAEVAELSQRVQELGQAPLESAPPQQPHQVLAQKLRAAQSDWFTVDAA